MRATLFRFSSLTGLSVLATACLVADPRPPPGKVELTASSDEAIQSGFTTLDGWTVRYERFLASLGHVSPEGDSCTFYSDAAYNRILDMRRGGSQHLSVIYALGACQIDFEVSSPWSDSVLGEGVTPADRDLMRTPASDDEVKDAGVSLSVRGVASKDGVEKRFDWALRKRIDSANCYASVDGKLVYGVDLQQNETVTRDLTVHGGVLFQDHLDGNLANLRFEPMALADDDHGDGDGDVTLSELGQMPLGELATPDAYADGDPDWTTLEHYVYRGLFLEIVRYQGHGSCEEQEVFPNDREPH